MTRNGHWRWTAVLSAIAILCVAGPGPAQEPPQEAAQQPPAAEPAPAEEPEAEVGEEITVTGTRVEGRAAVLSAAPIDYIDSAAMESVGALEVGKVLQLLEPSANFSTTFISDGTDAVRPATLRSLGPDQTLLLVNGKRWHQTALVHYQQTVGRGSAGYDVNTIPLAAIDHIEVLRDGAAAQYGSDAIAGVVNVILRGRTGVTDAAVDLGQTYEGDGSVVAGSVNSGWDIGEEGFVNLTAEYRDREETNRAGPDSLRVSPPQVTQRIGDPDAKDAYLWLNAALPVGDGELYAFGGYSQRETNSSGFFRSAGDGRTVPALYPDGFLPTIVTEPEDMHLAAGWRGGDPETWHFDFSVNWGQSEFAFREENTVNVSYWYEPLDPANPLGARHESSPTAADTGTLTYDQLSVNLEAFNEIDWGVGAGPLHMALGLEWRDEGYEIEPGDPVSYQYGRTNDFTIPIFNQLGPPNVAAPGTQGFPGFQQAVDESRDNIAAFADFESQLTEKFLAGVAVRYEDYSDFGSTVDWKASLRYDFTEKLALRGTFSTGFRAPGVQQAFFTLRSTNLDASGTLADTLTAANNSAIARALGIPALQEETSNNYSVGLVARPTDRFRVTVDAYRIDIDDRIVFSDAISAAIPPVGAILTPLGIGQVQFFTNAIDTQTDGLDIVALYDLPFETSLLTLEAALAFNDTEVTDRRSSSPIIPVDVLFPEAQVTLVEEGQPQEHYVLGATHHWGDLVSSLRFNYFGSVAAQWFTQPYKATWGGEWLTDLSFAYRLTDNMSISVGGVNIFDEYPEEWDPDRAFPFPQLGFTYGWETVPFGINGGYYYTRFKFRLGGA